MLKVYSIFDSKAGIFNPPFYQKNAGEASRSFSKIVNEPKSLINEFPEDYVLIEIGTFDDEKGIIEPSNHVTVGTASQHKRD